MTDIRDVLRSRLDELCKEYVDRHQISQSELARRLDLSPQKLDKYLRLQLQIRFPEAELFASFFGVSISWLCGESEIRDKLSPELQTAISQLLDKTSAPDPKRR